MGNRHRIWGVICVLIGAASYGLLSPQVKLAYDAGLSVGQATLGQVLCGTAITWLIAAVFHKGWKPFSQIPWIRLSLIGIFGMTLTTILLNYALDRLSASLTIVLLFQFTWITLVMGAVLSRTWPRPKQWLAVAIIMGGTLLCVGISPKDFSSLDWIGVLLGLGSAVSYSLFLEFTGRIRTEMPPLQKSVIMLTASLPIIMLMQPPMQIEIGVWSDVLLWGLLLGLIGSVIPTLLFNAGIPRIGGSLAAMLGSVELPVAIIGAFWLLGEAVGVGQWIGMLLIVAGIVVGER